MVVVVMDCICLLGASFVIGESEMYMALKVFLQFSTTD
jgi:hypothetical protein